MSIKKGFSLVEVLIFITIISLFFVAAMSVATFSLKNMQVSEHKIIAAHLAEEGMEWVKSEKETSWIDFVSRGVLTPDSRTYCLNNLDWLDGSICTIPGDGYIGTPNIFQRNVSLTNQAGTPTTSVNVLVEVSWNENGKTQKVPVETVLSLLE